MKKPVFDTNVFHTFKKVMTDADIADMALSVVVLYELAATTNDKSDRQRYEAWRKRFSMSGLLLVPTLSDWWEAAKIVARIRYGEKTARRGKTPPLPDAQRLQNDVLIARTAAMNGCFAVTSDTDDFLRIQTCLNKLEVVDAKEYFGTAAQ
jgi:predicted nucleic acid-binding protein